MKHLYLIFPIFAIVAHAEPTRDAGLSLHMLPERVAKLSGEKGGFTVTDPVTRKAGRTYSENQKLLVYITSLSASIKENGVWIVYTHPSSYSPDEVSRLDELITKLKEQNIRTFTCRASELQVRSWKEGTGINKQ